MTQLIDPNDIHSAADSWSGFIYQGKVALYHVLRLLIEDVNAPNYQLQLDSLEDFAIVDFDIKPITLHQVKAMKSNRYNDYKEAFEKLEKRIADFPCNEAYFHLATANQKSKADIESLHPTINVYGYLDGNSFCSLDSIDRSIEGLISSYFVNNNFNHLNNPNYRIIVRNCLEDIILSQVIAVHACNHRRNGLSINEGAYHFVIPFTNFIEILEANLNNKLNDENYFLCLTKADINRYFQEFCLELEDDEEVLEEVKQKLDNYLIKINALTDLEIIQFIKSIIPHREFKLDNITEYKDHNIQENEFKDAFLTCLQSLRESDNSNSGEFGWICNDDKRYYSTSIIDGEATKNKVCKRILKNITDNDLDIPFNSHRLITASIDVTSLEMETNKIINIEEDQEIIDKNHTRITSWGKVSLISLGNAITILNEDNN
ncbi:ABC-three component system protein [Flavobacterium adhaerens]|uniref:ABC-three component system protein n=1 Tax=Flavobacterium adhaerens TaxID=3149043 RepID=UPI0032B4A196